jgi:hypothetical protein
MAQFREYFTRVFISDTEITLTSTYGSVQLNDIVLRDVNMDTNFKTKLAAHRDAFLGLGPSSTSPSCYVDLRGHWIKQSPGATVTTVNATVTVPPGNSGILVYYSDTGYTVQYSVNGGSWTTITDGGTITVTNGQTLKFKGSSIADMDFIEAQVYDQDTAELIDTISLLNNTPTI